MTLEEMKFAVCEKLPELTYVSGLSAKLKWTDGRIINWPTEGLQVCHEAEKLLHKGEEQNNYYSLLHMITVKEPWITSNNYQCYMIATATYEQRLEALCRVWFPERFTNETQSNSLASPR